MEQELFFGLITVPSSNVFEVAFVMGFTIALGFMAFIDYALSQSAKDLNESD